MSITLSGNLSKNFTQQEYHKGTANVSMTKETIVFIRLIQRFRAWLGKPMYVISWARTKAENAKVGGIATSNHLLPRACAIDFYISGTTIDRGLFVKYAKEWANLCKTYGPCVGEAGLYTWGVHLGVQNSSQAKGNGYHFVHWDSRSGKQIMNPFAELRGL